MSGLQHDLWASCPHRVDRSALPTALSTSSSDFPRTHIVTSSSHGMGLKKHFTPTNHPLLGTLFLVTSFLYYENPQSFLLPFEFITGNPLSLWQASRRSRKLRGVEFLRCVKAALRSAGVRLCRRRFEAKRRVAKSNASCAMKGMRHLDFFYLEGQFFSSYKPLCDMKNLHHIFSAKKQAARMLQACLSEWISLKFPNRQFIVCFGPWGTGCFHFTLEGQDLFGCG